MHTYTNLHAHTIDTTNRLDWLKARQTHLTASEMPTIFDKTPVAMKKLIDTKKQPPREVQTRAMEFGHEREPHIIAQLQKQFPDYHLEHNKLLFENNTNPFHAATPDGIGYTTEGELINVEVKTTNKPRTEAPRDHIIQVQWALHVTGAQFCVYAWEHHKDYIPQDFGTQIIPRDEDLIAQLVECANQFEQLYDEPDDQEPIFDDMIKRYAQLKVHEEAIKKELASIQDELRTMLGDNPVPYSNPNIGSLDYRKPQPSLRFDSTRFKKEHPDTYKEYVKETNTKWGARIIPTREYMDMLRAQRDNHTPDNNLSEGNPFA